MQQAQTSALFSAQVHMHKESYIDLFPKTDLVYLTAGVSRPHCCLILINSMLAAVSIAK
jgi:hypothetical protein